MFLFSSRHRFPFESHTILQQRFFSEIGRKGMEESVDAKSNRRLQELQRDLDELRGLCVNGRLKGELPEAFLEQFKKLNADLYCKIFSYVAPSDLLKLRKVCTRWNDVIVRNCYRLIDGFRGIQPGRIGIGMRPACDGSVLYELRYIGDAVQPVLVEGDSLRFCIAPFSGHKFAVSLEGLTLELALKSLSHFQNALGEKTTINISKFTVENCKSSSEIVNADSLTKFLSSPHCKNLKDFQMKRVDLRNISVSPDEILGSLSVTLQELVVSFLDEHQGRGITDSGLRQIVCKNEIKNVSLENCSSISPEGVVCAVEALFVISDKTSRTFRSADAVKISVQRCERISKEAMKSLRRPKGDVEDDIPYQERGTTLTLMYKSRISRLPVNVYITEPTNHQ